MSDPKPTAAEALSRVMEDVQAIEKADRNQDQGFMFRGIDAVLDKVGPVLRKHGVVIIPRALNITTERYVTGKGTAMRNATVTMGYTVYGPAGDTIEGSAFGEAADSGDKAVSKAQSVAYRVFLLQGLTIPTRQADPDANSHERATYTQEAQDARDDLTEACQELGINLRQAMRDFAKANGGLDIRAATDPGPIRALAAKYREQNPFAPTEPTDEPTQEQGATDDQPA